ncbi:hypothetical protein LguiB_018424 [Lonicera macranthoides]
MNALVPYLLQNHVLGYPMLLDSIDGIGLYSIILNQPGSSAIPNRHIKFVKEICLRTIHRL